MIEKANDEKLDTEAEIASLVFILFFIVNCACSIRIILHMIGVWPL